MRYYFPPTRMAIISQIVTSVVKNMDKLEPIYTADENVKRYTQFGKQSGSCLKGQT